MHEFQRIKRLPPYVFAIVNQLKMEARRRGELLKLTGIGFRILRELAEAYPEAVTRSQLIHRLWGDEPPDSDALRSHIYSLRAALDKPFDTPMLKTLPNVGYRLVCDEA